MYYKENNKGKIEVIADSDFDKMKDPEETKKWEVLEIADIKEALHVKKALEEKIQQTEEKISSDYMTERFDDTKRNLQILNLLVNICPEILSSKTKLHKELEFIYLDDSDLPF